MENIVQKKYCVVYLFCFFVCEIKFSWYMFISLSEKMISFAYKAYLKCGFYREKYNLVCIPFSEISKLDLFLEFRKTTQHSVVKRSLFSKKVIFSACSNCKSGV